MSQTSNDIGDIVVLQRKLQAQRAGIDEKLRAVEITLGLLRNGGSSAVSELGGEDRYGLERTMTQVEALERIAKIDGTVKIKTAKLILEKAGLLKRTKNWYNILYAALNRSNKFEHAGPGEYRLKASGSAKPLFSHTAPSD